MSAGKKTPRRLERTFAFKVLYGLEFSKAITENDLTRAFSLSPDRPEGVEVENSYAFRIVKGVWENKQRLDAAISLYSQNWRVERMGKVEAAILRIAFFELMQNDPDAPHKVVINEAVELSKQYSDDKARRFVNGVLDAAAKAHETGALQQAFNGTN